MAAKKKAAAVVEPPESKAPVVPPPSLAAEELSNRDRLAGIVVRLEKEINDCDELVPRNHVAALYGQYQAAIEKLSKLDGDGEMSISKLLRSNAWQEVQAAMLVALEPHPQASLAIADAIRGLGQR